jgi:hypothetical protein
VNTPRPENFVDLGTLLGDRCDLGNVCQSDSTEQCPIGFYQPDYRKANCLICPAGYNCNEPGISDLTSFECAIGFYCEEGTGATLKPAQICPPGSKL